MATHRTKTLSIITVFLICAVQTFCITLLQAAKNGDYEEVRRFVEQVKLDVNLADKQGRTAISHASEGGFSAIVQYLLSKGAKASKADSIGWLPIHYEIRSGALKVTQLLCNQGAVLKNKYLITLIDKQNPISLQDFAFYWAYSDFKKLAPSSINYLAVLRALKEAQIKQGGRLAFSKLAFVADFRVKHSLLWEVMFGTLDNFKTLISKGSDPNSAEEPLTAATCASLFDNVDVYAYLLDTGFIEEPLREAFETALQFGYGLEIIKAIYKSEMQSQIMTLSINNKRFCKAVVESEYWRDMLDLLLSSEFNLMMKDLDEQNIPTAAIFSKLLTLSDTVEDVNFDVLKFLLDNGFDINAIGIGYEEDTLLTWALDFMDSRFAQKWAAENIVYLLESYPSLDVTKRNGVGQAPSALSAKAENEGARAVYDSLIKLGAPESDSTVDPVKQRMDDM